MPWTKFDDNMKIPVISWCEHLEPGAWEQAVNLASHPVIRHHVALMPDCHVGYGMPVGGVIAVEDALIPNAVGVDIGCGMIAVETDLTADVFNSMQERRQLLEQIKLRIPVGEGQHHHCGQQWDGFELYLSMTKNPPVPLGAIDRANLGTLGGGNHFIELQFDDRNNVWIMIHSGSRNLGHRIASHYHEAAKKMNEQHHIKLPSADLAYLPADSQAGQDYLRDMNFALQYALENRQRMMNVCKEELIKKFSTVTFRNEVNIHHNYAALENMGGNNYYIHRKGATSAKRGETGIIPGSMGTPSYIVTGLGNQESFMSCSHGAGRIMSRTEANNRLSMMDCDAAMAGIAFDRWKKCKNRRGMQKNSKLYDLSESPLAYKNIDQVIAAESDLIEPKVKLMPLGVVKG